MRMGNRPVTGAGTNLRQCGVAPTLVR